MQLRAAGRPPAGHASGRRRVVVCAAEGGKKRVVVLGGTGRVGSATAASLLETHGAEIEVAIAGRSRENYDACVQRRPQLRDAPYVACDIDDLTSVKVRVPCARRPPSDPAGAAGRPGR